MKRAVAHLIPYIEAEKQELGRRRRWSASLQRARAPGHCEGDVHRHRQEHRRRVLQCNNYEVIHLGVMVLALGFWRPRAGSRGTLSD